MLMFAIRLAGQPLPDERRLFGDQQEQRCCLISGGCNWVSGGCNRFSGC
jgi:hypothetical protein